MSKSLLRFEVILCQIKRAVRLSPVRRLTGNLFVHTKNLKKIYTTSLMTHVFIHVIVGIEKNRAGIAGSER